MSTPHDDEWLADVAPPDAGYEDLIALLNDVVERLERGDLSLDQALREYERGVALVRRCNDLLDRAELRVTELSLGLHRADEDAFIPGQRPAPLFEEDPDDDTFEDAE
ncbi:MAG: exodeoxyribonuclease VII small subunit [Sphaerobacter sp.]|nr:exodeoxyribonuclease VII small subunit [Sphaerobacter sp.]